MASAPPLKETGPGCCEVQFNDFKHFVDYVYSDMLDFDDYVWRGQRCATWPLESTLDRVHRLADVEVSRRASRTAAHLESFKYAVRGRRGPNPPSIKSENDWWALGQHHGLATPLLDWSHSPFVAAFFAFSAVAGKDQTPNRAVYALHQSEVRFTANRKAQLKDELRQKEMSKKNGGAVGALLHLKSEPDVVFVRPLSDENSRLVNQRGLFTRTYSEGTVEDWVKANIPADDTGWTLMKFLIPDTERTMCLRLLNRMNINPLSLFPDLAGASQYCNLLAQIKSY